MKIFCRTFGCKVNQYETDRIRQAWESQGALGVSLMKEADLCLINSCSVTAVADRECRQFIRRVLRENPRARVILTGCYATWAQEELARQFPSIEIYTNDEKDHLPACLGFDLKAEPFAGGVATHRTRAYVKIQDGCRSTCTYCIIPTTRPTLWNKPFREVEGELLSLLSQGYKEVVLTGIRLGLWRDEQGRGLTSLLERLIQYEGQFRLRLSSLEVTEVSEDLVRFISTTDKVCRHLHVPLQSADNEVLKSMGRWYTFERFQAVTSMIRRFCPDAGLTTDVLAGFPTETEAAYARTLERIELLGFTGLHVFPFSPRRGTVAATLDPLPKALVHQRVERLREVSDRLIKKFAQAQAGHQAWVVAEPEGLGWTDHYLKVPVPQDVPVGAWVLVTLPQPF